MSLPVCAIQRHDKPKFGAGGRNSRVVSPPSPGLGLVVFIDTSLVLNRLADHQRPNEPHHSTGAGHVERDTQPGNHTRRTAIDLAGERVDGVSSSQAFDLGDPEDRERRNG